MKKPDQGRIDVGGDSLMLRKYEASDYDFIHDTTKENMGEFVARYRGGWDPVMFRKDMREGDITIVERAGRCVAFFDLRQEEGALRLRNIQVVKTEQGRGIGGCIMAIVEGRAREAGGKIRLSVFVDNPAAKFYEKRGFRVVGRDECNLFMEKDCAESESKS